MTNRKNEITTDELFELLEYAFARRVRDDRYRELLGKYETARAERA